MQTRKRNRLDQYDYSTANAYFITICTCGKGNVLWRDVGAVIDRPENVPLSALGSIVQKSIAEIPVRYPAVTVDRFVIMPNHIHLLLQIHPDADGRSVIAPTISTVVRMMKGAASREAGFPLWQKGFYDHVVRNDVDYLDIWRYIEGNPGRWTEDSLFVAGDR